MIIRAPRPVDHYVIIRNDVVRDERLSYRARGLLVAILSRPDDWRTSARQLAREGPDGETAILTALRELEDLGYLQRVRRHGPSGRFVRDLVVYDTPGDRPPLPLDEGSQSGQMDPEGADSPVLAEPVLVDPVQVPPVLDGPVSYKGPITNNRDEEDPSLAVARERNYVWDGFVDVFGPADSPAARKRRGKNVAEVTHALAFQFGVRQGPIRQSPDSQAEVVGRAGRWPLHFGEATLTEEALAKHWVTLGRAPLRASGDGVRRVAEAERRAQRRARLEQEGSSLPAVGDRP